MGGNRVFGQSSKNLFEPFLCSSSSCSYFVSKRVLLYQSECVRVFPFSIVSKFYQHRAYLVTANKTDLGLCSEIVKACDSTSFGSKDIIFICGRAGVCALGAVVVKYSGDERLMNYYLSRFNEIKLPRSLPDELLYGRVGFLWACLFLNKHIGQGTVPPTYTGAVVSEIIKNGIRLANKGRCPLMFEWYGEKYWGAAHGLVGIMHVLMRMELIIDEKEMLKHRGCCSFSHDVMSKVPSSRLWGCFK